MHTIADSHHQPAVRPRRRGRGGVFGLLLIAAAILGGIVYPPTFLFAVREALGFEAWRYGFHLSVGHMDGSVTQPIWLYDARFSHSSTAGASTLLVIDKARTDFAWRHLFWERDERVWTGLMLDGVRGAIDLPPVTAPAAKGIPAPPRGLPKAPRVVLPSSLAIGHASIVIRQSGGGSVRFDDVDLQASDVETGRLVIGALSVQEPWMTGVFSNCRGSLALEDSKLMLADMKLTDSLTISSASAGLPELLRGQLEMEVALDAFSGNIEGEISSGIHGGHLIFESSGTFLHISVAQLAAFFGEDADGSIKEGKFTFHGSPRDLAKATFTTRFEAGNFRWGPRRWNSLVAGATYVDHRLQHLEFQLSQAHNSLMLKGNMSVPQNWKQWWTTDFSFDVAAKLDNLGELSALMGPEIGGIYGKLAVDGAVRGERGAYDGQLIVSGSDLSFGNAPLDELQAAIKLQGNEIQVTDAEFTHGDDFLRAHGTVNILGERRYWGEVKANVADLALYASFLQPPVAPEAFGGGLMLDWSGDGTRSAHSGAFKLRLSRLHPLVNGPADAGGWQPIDLNAVATYSPKSIFFSNLMLGNGKTTLVSRVVATPRSLTLEGLKLTHEGALWLSGDAQAPLNVWAAWQNPATASWWNFDNPCKLDLRMDRLSVRDVLALSGHRHPFGGELTGNIETEGTLAKLTAGGHLEIKEAEGTVPAGTLRDSAVTLDFKGDQAGLSQAAGNWNGVDWTASGAISASDVRKPSLDLSIKIPAAPLKLGSGISGIAALDLRATGRPDALALSGTAQLQKLDIGRRATLGSIVARGTTGLDGPPLALALAGPPAWKLNLRVAGNAAVALANTAGAAAPALDVSGSLGRPIVTGSVAVTGFPVTEGLDRLAIDSGGFILEAGRPAVLALEGSGAVGGNAFKGSIIGTLAGKRFTWGPAITAALAGRPAPLPSPAPPPAARPAASPAPSAKP